LAQHDITTKFPYVHQITFNNAEPASKSFTPCFGIFSNTCGKSPSIPSIQPYCLKKVERDDKRASTIGSLLREQLEQQQKLLKGAEKDAAVTEALNEVYYKFSEHNATIVAEYKKEIDLLKNKNTTHQSKDVENNELKAKAAEDAAKIAQLNSQITELSCIVVFLLQPYGLKLKMLH
jgi:metal-responsive CopG/Arc/MetJ family transcriptional regulator